MCWWEEPARSEESKTNGGIRYPQGIYDARGSWVTERQAQALLDVGKEGFGALVTKDYLDARLRELELRLTLRLGGMVAAGVAILAALELLSR